MNTNSVHSITPLTSDLRPLTLTHTVTYTLGIPLLSFISIHCLETFPYRFHRSNTSPRDTCLMHGPPNLSCHQQSSSRSVFFTLLKSSVCYTFMTKSTYLVLWFPSQFHFSPSYKSNSVSFSVINPL